ncbi:ABC transporter permease [Fulvivirga lutea]|uniref:ABC transporter permease n=1 Tax=Fulvivirga lutea TaxID=2810512 RepID=A0A974WGW6_9BACT|nr:ABC transporter permease [Fulvivirga lutea]QSE95870.1 ABC transporter permease [Fulvivirga lutea]
MIRNYLITTLRNVYRNRVNSFLNIFGLSLGITSSIVLFLLYSYYVSFDTFQSNYDNIYRLVTESDGAGGNRDYNPGVAPPLTDAFAEDFESIDAITLVIDLYGPQLFYLPSTDKIFDESYELRLAYSTQSYFNIFDLDILKGNPENMLSTANQVVISERLAQKYFGEADPLNKVIQHQKNTDYVVTGVFANPPKNSDFPFEMILSYQTIKKEHLKRGWRSVTSNDQCYLLIKDKQQLAQIKSGLDAFVKKYYGKTPEEHDNRVISLQPLSNLHFNAQYDNFSYETMTDSDLLIIVLVAIFLIITSCINFVNLSTAIAVKRSKEVGVRKTLGGTRSELIFQFLGESFALTFISVALSLGLTELFLLYINPYLELSLDLNLIGNLNHLLFVVILLVSVTLAAGLYPAFVLSSFKPAIALKNNINSASSSKFSLRKALVVFQFLISQVFIIATIVMAYQMHYVMNKDLGFKSDAILNVELPGSDHQKKHILKSQLQGIEGVEMVSLAGTNPASSSIGVTNISISGVEGEFDVSIKHADNQYIDVFQIPLLEGKNIGASDTISGIMVSKELLRLAGLDNAEDVVGREVKIYGKKVPITGVIDDFNSLSLNHELIPVIVYSQLPSYRIACIQVKMANVNATLTKIEQTWKKLYPEYNFDYSFLDEQLAEFYEGYQRLSVVFTIFSGIAIFIGCLGLYGLTAFTVNQKTKEIGIRKVLGASVVSILMLFSKEFFTLVIVAFVFALPISWYMTDGLLQEFHYKIELSPLIYAAGFFATLLIAIITAGYKSGKAAMANPVQSLRDE